MLVNLLLDFFPALHAVSHCDVDLITSLEALESGCNQCNATSSALLEGSSRYGNMCLIFLLFFFFSHHILYVDGVSF